MKLLIVNGPNLNLLGTREPDIYGTETLADLEQQWLACAADLGIDVVTAQSNSEGAIIDVIHDARDDVDGIVINAGALTHYSLALADALTAVGLPFVEVHISNVHAREPWRHHSVLSEGADAVIFGRGTRGYIDAIAHLYAVVTSPPVVVSYGPTQSNVMDVRTPDGDGPHPGVMIVHGGYWEDIWLRDLMDPMALDLTSRGFSTFNVEYTTGDGSYPAAITDILGAFDHIVEHAGEFNLDPTRLVVVGHSAGGFLAVHVAHRRSRFAGVVGLGSIVDLDTVAVDCPEDNPVDHFIGGSRVEEPDMWEGATIVGTPEVPVRLIHGSDDEFVTPIHAEHYVQMTRGAGMLTMLGGVGHMELIDPRHDVWVEVLDAITQTVAH